MQERNWPRSPNNSVHRPSARWMRKIRHRCIASCGTWILRPGCISTGISGLRGVLAEIAATVGGGGERSASVTCCSIWTARIFRPAGGGRLDTVAFDRRLIFAACSLACFSLAMLASSSSSRSGSPNSSSSVRRRFSLSVCSGGVATGGSASCSTKRPTLSNSFSSDSSDILA